MDLAKNARTPETIFATVALVAIVVGWGQSARADEASDRATRQRLEASERAFDRCSERCQGECRQVGPVNYQCTPVHRRGTFGDDWGRQSPQRDR